MRRPLKLVYNSLKLFLRILALFALLILLTLAGAAFLLKTMFTPESIKAIVVSELQNVLKRPVEVRSVNVLIYQGVQIRGLRVLETGGFPGSNFIESDIVVAKYKWRALLDKKLELSELRFVSPRIQVSRNEAGKWNVEDIFASSSTHHAEARAGSFRLPFSLAADVIAMDHGEIYVQDVLRNHRYEFKGVDLEVDQFDVQKPFRVKGKFENTSQLPSGDLHDHFSFNGVMSLAGFRWDDSKFSAETIQGEVEGHPVTGSGSLKDFRKPLITVAAKAPPMDSDFLRHFWRKAPPGIEIPPAKWTLQLSLPATGYLELEHGDAIAEPVHLHVKGSLTFLSAGQRWQLFAVMAQAPLQTVSKLWQGFQKYGLSGTASGNVSLSGEWGDNPPPILLHSVSVSAKGLGGTFFRARDRFSNVDLNFAGKDDLDDITFSVSQGTGVIYGAPFSDINLALRFHKGDVSLDRLNLTWDASRLKLCGRVKNISAPKDVRMDASVDRLRLDQAIAVGTQIAHQIKPPESKPKTGPWSQIFKYSFPKKFPATAGRLRVADVVAPNFETHNFSGLWNLRGISTGLAKASGDIKLSFGPGRASDIPALEESSSIIRTLFLPFVFMHRLNNLAVISAATAYPKTLDFSKISGEYGLKSGVLDMRSFQVDSGVLKAYADGTVDFPRENVSLHVLTLLTDQRGALPEYLTDESGRPAIGFFVEKDLNKPELTIDLHKQAADAIDKAVERSAKRSQPVFKNLEGGGLCTVQ